MKSIPKSTELRLINLRWLSVATMLTVALLSKNVVGSFDLAPRLLAIAAIVAVMNGVLLFVAKRPPAGTERLPVLEAFFQFCIDLMAWSGYLYLAGGATNPLISVFLPLVAMGAMVLTRIQAWTFGGLAIFAYTFLWKFYEPLPIQDAYTSTRLHILGMWLVFVVSDVIVVWFIVQMTIAIRARDTALANAREQAIRNDWLVSMGSLAAGAAHELSTPLGTLNILVDDLIEDASSNDKLRPDLELMRRQIESCKRALNQLTQRSGSPRCTGEIGGTPGFNLQGMIDAWMAINPSVGVSFEASPELGRSSIPYDASIERALTNLLDNAEQAGASHLVLSAKIDSMQLSLLIEDDGPGIDDHALRSFQSGMPVASARGMGVGLLLARAAMDRCGGQIHLSRLPQGGTRAHVVLPMDRAKETSNG